jgi:hypothetical protein
VLANNINRPDGENAKHEDYVCRKMHSSAQMRAINLAGLRFYFTIPFSLIISQCFMPAVLNVFAFFRGAGFHLFHVFILIFPTDSFCICSSFVKNENTD